MPSITIKSKKFGDQICLVSRRDLKEVSKYNWYLLRGSNTFYASRYVKLGKYNYTTQLMHSFIMDTPKGKVIDHKDHNGLNNTRRNIRITTQSKNLVNRRPDKRNTTGFRGVGLYRGREDKFCVWIKVNGRTINGGLYNDKIQAAKRYNSLALKHFGRSFAILNPV